MTYMWKNNYQSQTSSGLKYMINVYKLLNYQVLGILLGRIISYNQPLHWWPAYYDALSYHWCPCCAEQGLFPQAVCCFAERAYSLGIGQLFQCSTESRLRCPASRKSYLLSEAYWLRHRAMFKQCCSRSSCASSVCIVDCCCWRGGQMNYTGIHILNLRYSLLAKFLF